MMKRANFLDRMNEKRANSFILFCCICNFRVIRADFAFFGQFWPIKIRNIGKFHWLDFFLDQFDRFIYKSVCWDYFFLLFFQGVEPDSKISEKRKLPVALRVNKLMIVVVQILIIDLVRR